MASPSQPNKWNIRGKIFSLQDQTIGRLAQCNYYTAKAYHYHKLRLLDSQHQDLPLLIYQMGKVGSTTVEKALRNAKIGRRLYSVHYLTPDWLLKYDQKRKEEFTTTKQNKLKYVWTAQYVSKLVKEQLQKGARWQIVTLVRDPVARNLSSFFQHIRIESPVSEKEYKLKSREYDFEVVIFDNNLKDVIDIFFERSRHDTPLTFFDREFKGTLNIDIFESDFATEKGYQILHTDQADVLLIRLEDLNHCATEALKTFLNIDNLELRGANIGGKKEYANAYHQFKRAIVLPESYLDKMYNSKYARHFYTEAEIEKFRARWLK